MSKLVAFLASSTGLSPADIRGVINQAPVSYKRYTIAKRTGGRREISQPAREVKALQRLLVKRLSALPIHEAATAYRQNASIRVNAIRHAGAGPVLKFDFQDFFLSLRDRDWEAYCRKYSVFASEEDISLSTRLLFTRTRGSTILRLAIGAPSSPWLSNVLMYEFDTAISQAVAKEHVTYTRYADDMTFSAPRTGFLNHVEEKLAKLIRSLDSPRLKLNHEKTVTATRKYRRVVTGLVLSDDGRVTIGRDRKRSVRAALHHAALGKLDPEELARLAGLIAYIKSVDPEFFDYICKLYGPDIIKRLSHATS